jgi:hydrogenase nickel incorporation protein HypB
MNGVITMHKTVDVKLGADILEANSELANRNSLRLQEAGIKAFDFMGSIGSGKTLLIEGLVDKLKEKNIRAGAIAGDVSGNDDFLRFQNHDIQVANINTDKDCHLDAHLIEHTLESLNLSDIDVLFIENVGNLVCPADFPLGTDKRVVVISVTEGDDMVRKHPVIFGLADIIVVNKIDLAEVVEVDIDVIKSDAAAVAPHTKLITTDAKHGIGLDILLSELGL